MSTSNEGVPHTPAKPIIVTVVGDNGSGKTAFIVTHTTGEFPTHGYNPVARGLFTSDETVDGVKYSLTIQDTSGNEDYARLRPLSYYKSNKFILCFSLQSRRSYDSIASKWLPELRHHCPTVPVLLVGTRSDERDAAVLCAEDGLRLCQDEGLVQYLECSALTRDGLTEVFETAAKSSVDFVEKKSPKKCCIS